MPRRYIKIAGQKTDPFEKVETIVVESHPFSIQRQKMLVSLTPEQVDELRKECPELVIRKPSDPKEVEELSDVSQDEDLTDRVSKALQMLI